ncbi:ABC transporter permease [Enterococcus sp.]|uniref:ABC transporter permease n=1 Tax=Enterococcus sp. TaxID=35783 RepID=UPI002FC86363
MNFFKLITNNVLRSKRTYGGYFLSSSFSVFVFFLFAILNFHPQLKSGLGGSSDTVAGLATMGMTVSQILIVALSFIFLWYSFGIFSKARKRELSIYVMLGIKPRDLRRLLFGENMVIGIGAILTGVTFGLIFMKAILIIVQKILSLPTGLDFYFPTIGIALTIGIYVILFLLVSFFLTLRIETANLTQLGKSDETPEKTPKANPLFVLLAFLCIGLGYGAMVYFVRSIYNSNVFILIACVFFTVIGTFLFFHQVSVYYYLWKKKQQKYWQGKNLILTAAGVYRGKENANLFALITCTAAVALVGVSVTASLGSTQTSTRNNIPVAIMITHNDINTNDTTDQSPILTMGEEIFKDLKEAGYQPTYEKILAYSFEYSNEANDFSTYTSAISASDYNRAAKQLGLEMFHPKENEMFLMANNLENIERIKESPQTTAVITEFNQQQFSLTEVPASFRLIFYQSTVIVPDSLAEQMKKDPEIGPYPTIFQLINYKNWNDGSQVNKSIIANLNQKTADFQEKIDALHNAEPGEVSDEVWNDAFDEYFDFESLYNTVLQKRQANGFILMIGLLIGGVFFLFASSILYFRLFGDLDKEGRFHRSLYQIGLTPKMRHQIVTRQLLSMYFLPMLVATFHSAVAFWGLVQLVEINIWHYFFIIIAVYFTLQFLLFWISRWRYLTHLDLRAENPQAF